jgi:TolB-like protein
MSPRPVRPGAANTKVPRRVAAIAPPTADRAAASWRCLVSSIPVAVAPLRNLTGDADRQHFVEAFTDDLFKDLSRHGRGFSLQRRAAEPKVLDDAVGLTDPNITYVVTGSAQRGRPGMLRVNVQITDVATSEYLWARRYEFGTEQVESVQSKIIRRISRTLHVLLLQQEIRRATLESNAEPELGECLSSAATALERELRPDHTAEAQRLFLAALADDPRNVEALVGLARTYQELVSNPWWGDPAAAVASDMGREVVAIALDLAPGHADAHCVQGMLYSAAGELDEAARAFDRALALDSGLAIAHGFAGYNAAFLGSASDTLPAIERAMRLDRADRRHSIWFFFGGFAELLVGRAEASIALLEKSLERNRSYGSAQLFLMAALSLSGRPTEAATAAASFRQQYPDCPATAFERLWLSRSGSATYRAQILPVFERIRGLGAAT